MPFWQQSGNSNSSHLRTVPSECAASTRSCIKLHSAKPPVWASIPTFFSTPIQDITQYFSVSALCEALLVKSVWRPPVVEPNPFLDTPHVLEIRRDFMFFFPSDLSRLPTHWTESHPLLLHAVLTEGFRMLNPAVHQIMQPDIDTKLQTRRNPAGTLTVYRKSKRHRTSYQIQAAYSNKIFLSREKRDTWELIGCGSQTGVINASVAGAANTLSGC